jgi:predicted P-loop ATPase
MCDFAGSDANVRLTVGRERRSAAESDFANAEALPEQKISDAGELISNDEWLTELERDRKGNIYQTIANAKTVLTKDPLLRGCFGLDEFSGRISIMRNLPWRKIDENNNYLTDAAEANLRGYMESMYGLTSRSAIKDALSINISANTFHPIKNYLNDLSWDGVPRVDELLIKYLGVADCEYTRAVTRKTLVAAVARIMQPGIKFDYMLTLAGPEGKGKSTLINKLAGKWFSDSFTTVEGTKAMEQIQGCWIIESGEMKALKRAEVASVKHFIAKRQDIFRPAYGHNVIYPKRQCIFIGTTNDAEPLKGENGDRRFWIVHTNATHPRANIKDKDALGEAERSQIWAECVQLYRDGEEIYLDDTLEDVARIKQKEAAEIDDRTGFIAEYLSKKLPVEWQNMNIMERRSWLNDTDPQSPGVVERTAVCVAEIYVECLEGKRESITRYNTRDIHHILSKIEGWEPSIKMRFGFYGPQKSYVKVNINSPVKNENDELFIS